MKFDTNQQPTKKTKVKKDKVEKVESNYLMMHGRNYCDCLEYVWNYSSLGKNFVVVYVDVEEKFEHFYQEEDLSWQIWRDHYLPLPKYYLASPLLDKRAQVYDNSIKAPIEGYKRIYRGIPQCDLSAKTFEPKKAKSFVKKVLVK